MGRVPQTSAGSGRLTPESGGTLKAHSEGAGTGAGSMPLHAATAPGRYYLRDRGLHIQHNGSYSGGFGGTAAKVQWT